MRRRLAVVVLAVGILGAACTPPPPDEAKNPVLIVAGTLSPGFVVDPLASRLTSDGFTVYTMTIPGLGLGDIAASSVAVADEVAAIRAAHDGRRVDLVGHSQGGLVNRYYLQHLGGTDHVGTYVSLGTPHGGAYAANLLNFFGLGSCLGVVACQQMMIGSDFLADLNAGDTTPGPVEYYAIYTKQDELVQPYPNGALSGATNVLVQHECPLRVVGHVTLVTDGAVYGLVQSSLEGGPVTTNCFAL